MQRFISLLAFLGIIGVVSSQTYAQPAGPKGSLDPLINWDNPWDLTPAKFTQVADALPKKKSERAYSTQVIRNGAAVMYSIGPGTLIGSSGGGKMNLFNDALQVDSVTASFEKDKLVTFSFDLGVAYGAENRKPSAKDLGKFKAEMAKVTGDMSPKSYGVQAGPGNPPRTGLQWTHRNYIVQMFEYTMGGLSGREVVKKGIYTVRILPVAAN